MRPLLVRVCNQWLGMVPQLRCLPWAASDVFAGPAGQAEPRASVGDFGASTNRLVANAEAPAGAGACTPVRSAGTETGSTIRQPTGSGDATPRTSRPNAHRHNHKGW